MCVRVCVRVCAHLCVCARASCGAEVSPQCLSKGQVPATDREERPLLEAQGVLWVLGIRDQRASPCMAPRLSLCHSFPREALSFAIAELLAGGLTFCGALLFL